MKAKMISLKKGHKIIIAKDGHAPMLLLEWIAQQQMSGLSTIVTGVRIRESRNVKKDIATLSVSFPFANQAMHTNCTHYINANI